MKKIVSIMLVCLFVFTGILATSFAVNADSNVSFTNNDFNHFIDILVNSLKGVQDAGTRAARFRMYLDSIGKRDSEIDARIAELNSGSAIGDRMLNDLIGGGMTKDQVELILQVLKSIPQADRVAAINEFYANQANGAYYAELDPASPDYNAELDSAYQGIYNKYIDGTFRDTVYADYGLEYIDFVPFIRAITKNIHFTTDSDGRLAVLNVSDAFGENILANVTATSVNNVAIVDKFTVIDQIIGKFYDGTTPDNSENFQKAWDGEGAYELVGNISGDDEGNVDLVDADILAKYIVGWTSVKAEVNADPARLSAGAMIYPTANDVVDTDDLLKLLQYLAAWPGIILGRATNNSYIG